MLSHRTMVHNTERLTRILASGHPAVGVTVSRETVEALGARTVAGLPDSATVLAFAGRLRPLLDTLGDGHAMLWPRGARWRALLQPPRRVLPLSLKPADDGHLRVAGVSPTLRGALVDPARADSLTYDSLLRGRAVLSIDGEVAGNLVAESSWFTGGSDGVNRSGQRAYATERLGGHLAWSRGPRDRFAVTLATRRGDTTVVLPAFDPVAWRRGRPQPTLDDQAVDSATTTTPADTIGARRVARSARTARPPRRMRPSRRSRAINYGFDSTRRVAVAQVATFAAPGDPFNVWWPYALRRTVRQMRRDGARAVVLDLRGNGGGRTANVARLLRYLVAERTPVYGPWTFPVGGWVRADAAYKPFLLPSLLLGRGPRRRFGRVMRHAVRPRGPSRRVGLPLVVLSDAQTFSAAATTAAVLRSTGRAVVAGEESGGGYAQTFAGLFSRKRLGRSGLQLRLPAFHIPLAVDPSVQPLDRGVLSDVPLALTEADLRDPRDLVLLGALELAARAQQTGG